MTLRGVVLPVGSIKEKVLAAHRGGITHVILPHRNFKNLAELPTNVKNDLKFTLAHNIQEVLEVRRREKIGRRGGGERLCMFMTDCWYR